MLTYKLDILLSLVDRGVVLPISLLKWCSAAPRLTELCVNMQVPDKDALFQAGDDDIMSPILPVYDIDDNLLGFTYPSRKGLRLYSTLRLTDDESLNWSIITSSSILLSWYKIKARKIVDDVITEYDIPDDNKPLLALPVIPIAPGVDISDLSGSLVHTVVLYNMLSNRVLYVDCTSDTGISTILDAMLQLANVSINEDIIQISLSDGVIDIAALMNCCEEKAALSLCHPEVYTGDFLNIDEPSTEFNFYSPSLRLNRIVISPRTGTTRLKIYNLKSYNRLHVPGFNSSERTIVLSSNSSGCLACSDVRQKTDIKLVCSEMFNIDFVMFASLSISADYVRTLHLESGKFVDLSRVRSIDRLILSSVETVEGFSRAKLQYLSVDDTDLNNLVVLDAKEYVSIENGTFTNSSIVHSDYVQCRGGTVKHVEFEDVPIVNLDYAYLEDVIVHQGTMLCLGDSNLGTCHGNIRFREKEPARYEEFTLAYRFFRSNISIDMEAEGGLHVDACEFCTLDFTSCSASEITLCAMIYVVDGLMKQLFDYADRYTWLVFFTSIFNRLDIRVAKNTKLNIELDLKYFREDGDIATRRVGAHFKDDVTAINLRFTKKMRNRDLMATPYFIGSEDSDDSILRRYQNTYRDLIKRLRERSNLTSLCTFELSDLA